ncbi:MAG: signal peptide peptidase SppA [Candidatus Woesebacteria bacterium]|jgi:protease-4
MNTDKVTTFLKNLLTIFFKLWFALAKVLGSLVLAIIILIIVLAAKGSSAEESSKFGKTIREGGDNQIVVVRLTGEIVETSDSSSPFDFNPFLISSSRTREIFNELAKKDEVKAVILHLNTPGGGVVASDEIYKQIRELRKQKVVLMLFGEVAASGGYYIASAADKIIANPSTITGSIGVIAMTPDLTELYGKIGVSVNTYKSGQFKDLGSPSRSTTEEDKEIFQSIISDAYEQFIDRILESREIDENKLRKLADGRIYSGKQAYEHGLVDELGGLDEAIDLASDLAAITDPTVVEYQDFGWFESFLSSTNQMFLPNSLSAFILPQRKAGVYYLWN